MHAVSGHQCHTDSGWTKKFCFPKEDEHRRVLHYDAIAPDAWKTGLIKCMLHRADLICSDEHAREKEFSNLKDIFFRNGYPMEMFEKVKTKFLENMAQKNEKTKENENSTELTVKKEVKHVLKIPYVGKSSILYAKRIRRLLQAINADIRVVFKTTKVLESFQLKDPVPKELRPKVVYEFTCRGDPDITYVGFTNRTLKERVKEHVSGKTSISDHIAHCNPCQDQGVTMDDFRILRKCRQKWDTSIHEALIITEKNPILNRQLVKPGGKQFTLRIFD